MRPKDQGTRFESFIVAAAEVKGYDAWRLAEGGEHDLGDVVIRTGDGDHYVIECKHRERLQVHTELAKALRKVEEANAPFVPAGTAVLWKRSVKKDGNKTRSPVGTGIIVAITLEEYLEFIGR